MNIISKYKVDFLLTGPSEMSSIVASPNIRDYDLSSVIRYVATGSATAPGVVQKMKLHMPKAKFYSGYGCSEVGIFISMGELTADRSTGQVVANIDIKIVSDEGKNLPPNETGEIYVKANKNWAGYYNNPEATANAYDEQGWNHTGDLGFISSEGNLYVVDRKKEILKFRGYSYSPSEIESVILELPEVAEVCVFGIPDDIFLHLPSAAIVKVQGTEITEDQIKEYVANKMADYKQLRGGVYFTDSLPKTPSGKIIRRLVAEKYCSAK